MLDRLNRLHSFFVKYQENLTQMSGRIQSWAENGYRDGIFPGHIAEELSNGVARSKAHLKSSVYELQMIVSKWLNSGRDAYHIAQKVDEYEKQR